MHLPPVPRFLIKSLLRLIMVALFVGIPAALLTARYVGIGFGLRERIAEQLSGKEFRATIDKLAFDPFQGVIAQGVGMFSLESDARKLAFIRQIVVSLSLSDLLTGKITVERIRLRDSNITIPFEEDSTFQVRGVDADISILADQLRISHFQGDFQGIRIRLSGLLSHPYALRLHLLQEQDRQDGTSGLLKDLPDILNALEDMRYPGGRPTLTAQISGDLSDPSTVQAYPITLRSGPIVSPKWRIESLQADARYEKGNLTVERMTIRDKQGAFVLWAEYADRQVQFEASSSLSAAPLDVFLPDDSPVRQFDFRHAPILEIRGSGDLSAPKASWFVTGSLQLGDFSFRGIDCDEFRADFAYKDGQVFIREAQLHAQDGQAQADVLVAPEGVRVRATNTIKPTVFAPALDEKAQEFLSHMEFKDAPYAEVNLQGKSFHFADLSGDGFLKLGRTGMRDSWIDSGQSSLHIEDKAVTYRDLVITKGKGVGTGSFTYDFGRQEVRLRDIVSTLVPVDVMMWIDPKIAETIKPYRFHASPRVTVEGLVHLKEQKKNDLALTIDAASGLDYDLLNRTLSFGKTAAKVKVDGAVLKANVSRALLMDGEASILATVSLDPKDKTFGADVNFKNINFEKITKLYFNYDDSKGVMSGKYSFTSEMGHETRMKGVGSIRVEDGYVFAIPFLGPFSEILSAIIPGVGFEAARVASADFTVGDEKINTKNLEIEGVGFSMYGNGTIFFMTDKMDLSMRINARGLPGIVLFPVSKLFEYVSTGSVAEPNWRPKIIPRFGNGSKNESSTKPANSSSR